MGDRGPPEGWVWIDEFSDMPERLWALPLGPRPISEPFPFLNHRTVKEVDEGVSGRSPTTGGTEA